MKARATGLLHVCDMSRPYACDGLPHMCDMPDSCVCHECLTYVTRLRHMGDMNHAYV